MASKVGVAGFPRKLRPNLLQKIVRWVVRPTVIQSGVQSLNSPIFVLHRKSAFDAALLKNVLLDISDNHSGNSRDTQEVNSFFLLRPTGWRRRYSMHKFSPAMVEWQESILAGSHSDTLVVPVAMFWGRTAQRKKFLWRDIVSERYGPSFSLRRILTLLFSRSDVLVEFGAPIDWSSQSNRSKSLNWNLRHIAIQLRRQFKEIRHASLGPDLYRLEETVERVVNEVVTTLPADRTPASKSYRQTLKREVRKMATRMSYPAVMFVRTILRWYFKRVYDGLVMLGRDRLESVAKTHTLIYAPNHRSQTDYLVLSYLLFQHGFAIPQIASGDNLDIPVVGPILRRCGAFFMRRSFRDDPVYESVFESYLRLCVEQGSSIEFFVEGGRSRTGLLLPPRFGLLSMIVASREKGLPRPVAVVPTYISYESVPETNAYVNELSGKPKSPEKLSDVVLSLRLLRSKFGRVTVHIAKPIKLDNFVGQGSVKEETERLGYAITHAINNAVVIAPINLVALVLLTSPTYCIDEVSFIEQLKSVLGLLQTEANRLDLVLPIDEPQALIDRCVRLGLVRRELDGADALITCDRASAEKLTWFRNNILHVVAIPSLTAALLLNRESPIEIRELTQTANFLLPFVSQQLSFGSNLRTIRRWITHLEKEGLIERANDSQLVATRSAEKRLELRLLSRFATPMLNRFYIVLLTLLRTEDSSITVQSLSGRARRSSQLLARIQGDEFPPFIDRQFFDNVSTMMVAMGVVDLRDDRQIVPNELAETVLAQAESVFSIDYRLLVEHYVDHVSREVAVSDNSGDS